MATAALLDVRNPILDDLPAEWRPVDAETLRMLRPRNGLSTPEQARMFDRIAAARFFLIRNTGATEGYAFRCRRCKQIHAHLTTHCIERPFTGLSHVLGVLSERMGPEIVFSGVALGAIDPITRERAKVLYERLRGLGYTRRQLFGE